MNIARKALAAAAIAGLGMTAFAASAVAAPPAKPKALTPPPAGNYYVATTGGDINPTRITPRAGATYTITGEISLWDNNQGQNTFNVTYNAAPAGGAVNCTATGTKGAAVTAGKLTWTNVSGGTATQPTTVNYTINCKYVRDHSGVINETIKLNSQNHTVVDANGTIGSSYSNPYTIGGVLPSTSASPTTKPTAKPTTPVKDKDSNGGLAKTGF